MTDDDEDKRLLDKFGSHAMARRPVPKEQRSGHLVNGGFTLGLFLFLGFALADSRRVMPSMTLIIAIYAIGLIATAIAWFWDFRWKEELYLIGKVAIVYSLVVLILAGQFLFALGAFVFLLVVLIYPPIARQTHEAVRNRRRQGL
jgi:hypothetical protein